MKTVSVARLEQISLPTLGDALDFLRVIWAVDHALHRRSKRMEATLGVTGPQRLVLRIVGRFPGLAAGQLAKLLHVHPSTLTGVIKRLEQQGFLRRRVDPRDRRRTFLGLTEKGRPLYVEIRGTVESAIQRVFETTAPDKLRAAREVLEAIATELASEADDGASSLDSKNGR
jgi:DNA-binding MarR family transcriptional regulator